MEENWRRWKKNPFSRYNKNPFLKKNEKSTREEISKNGTRKRMRKIDEGSKKTENIWKN